MVLFPQHAPYTDPLRVLICGGSTPGPGVFVLSPRIQMLTSIPLQRLLAIIVFPSLPKSRMLSGPLKGWYDVLPPDQLSRI